jgi:hypothetical protein
MRRFIYGQIMGAIQLIFWLIMIPWIIITIPLDLYYTNPLHEATAWLAAIFEQSWVDWKYGLMIISTLNMILFTLAMIWLGWTMMHPLTKDNLELSNINRLKLVKSFSKKKFLQELHEEAREFQNKRFK